MVFHLTAKSITAQGPNALNIGKKLDYSTHFMLIKEKTQL